MRTPHSTQRGILLLESLVAILLISFGVLGLVALWANSVKNASETKYRSDASFLANEMIGRMWLDRTSVAPGYTVPTDWTTRVGATLPGGGGTIEVVPAPGLPAGQWEVTVTVTWLLPGHDPHQFISVAQINTAGPM